jgi:hypothetical protein
MDKQDVYIMHTWIDNNSYFSERRLVVDANTLERLVNSLVSKDAKKMTELGWQYVDDIHKRTDIEKFKRLLREYRETHLWSIPEGEIERICDWLDKEQP